MGLADAFSVSAVSDVPEIETETFYYRNNLPDGTEVVVGAHRLSQSELLAQHEQLGTASEGVNYNVIVDGHGTGYRPPTESEWERIAAEGLVIDEIVRADSALAAPPSIDWSTSQYFPPIGNQDGEGSCTCWAVAYYTKTFQEAIEHDWDLSGAAWEGGYHGHPSAAYQEMIFSPDFLYHQINYGADNGSSFSWACDVIGEIGAATWSTMPYDPADHTTWPTEAAWREAPIYRGDGGADFLDVRTSVGTLKTLLAGGNFGKIAIDASVMFEMATLDNFDNLVINHAQTLVGYDDNWTYTEAGQTRHGAFKVANSWGPTWDGETNNDGCWWISYAALQQRVGWVWFMNDRTGYNPETIAAFEIDHSVRGDTDVILGMGTTTTPTATKSFISPGRSCDGDDPYPGNPIILDITEFDVDPSSLPPLFVGVADSGTASTGTIVSFAVECYTDYLNGIPLTSSVSVDTPVDTVQGGTVYAEISVPIERLAPFGGLMFVSGSDFGSLASGSDHGDYDFFVEGGQTISACVKPFSSVSLSVELVGLPGKLTSPSAGAPVVLPPTAIASNGMYTLRVTGSGATEYNLIAFRNAALETEVDDTADGNELAIDTSLIALGPGRLGVIGRSDAVVTPMLHFAHSNSPSQFIDISATGIPLTLTDEGEVNITTSVGNSIFPAGIVTVGNNGGIIAGGGAQLSWINAALPTWSFGNALLPFWDDFGATTGNVFWEERELNDINALIVQWENRPHSPHIGGVTFQVQLFESGPVLARFAYEDVTFGNSLYDYGKSATVGYQAGSSSAVQFSHNSPALADGDVLDLTAAPIVEVDEYEIDLTGKAGQPIDIVLAGYHGADFGGQTLELLDTDGTTVLATAVTDPIQTGVDATNYDLGILGFTVRADGVYTVRLTSYVPGQYALVVTDPLSFDTEPNDIAAEHPLRDLTDTNAALGHLSAATDQDDFYRIDLALNQSLTISTQTPFDSPSTTPVNTLDPELEVIPPDGAPIAASDLDLADGKNAQLSFVAPQAGTYRIRVGATSGDGEYLLKIATVEAILLGDYNGNDVVDAADYCVWRDAFEAGTTGLPNDPTPDAVDETDYTYWRAHFGDTLPPLGAGSGALQAGRAADDVAATDVQPLALPGVDGDSAAGEALVTTIQPPAVPGGDAVARLATDVATANLSAELADEFVSSISIDSRQATLSRLSGPRVREAVASITTQRDDLLLAWVASRWEGARRDDAGSEELFALSDEALMNTDDALLGAVDVVFETLGR